MKPVREMVTVPPSCAKLGEVEHLQPLDAGKAGIAQHGEGGRALQGQPGDGFGLFLDVDVEAQRRCRAARADAAPGSTGGSASSTAGTACRRRAHGPRRRTRRCSGRGPASAWSTSRRVTRLRKASASGPSMRYFDHRRDVEQRRLAADGEIFELLVPQRMRRAVAGPIVPVLGPAPAPRCAAGRARPSRSVRKWAWSPRTVSEAARAGGMEGRCIALSLRSA